MTTNRKPLEIALIRRRFDPTGGGAEKVAAKFVDGFIERGHTVTFFGEKFYGEGSDKLKFHRLHKNLFATSGTTGFHRAAQFALEPYRYKYDVIYSMCRTFPVDVFRVTEQLHAEWLPMAYSPMAMFNPRHFGILKLERACLKPQNTRFVVTNSKLVRQQVIERFNYPEDRIQVISNGVDREVFFPVESAEKLQLRQQLSLPEDKLIFLFVAANFKTKRLGKAIEILGGMNETQRKKTLLLVVGGDDPQPYQEQAEQAGVEIFFAGKSNAMRQYYCAADLLFYPSIYEPFANVCLEAAACALPVLTTRLNGSSELVSHGENGYIVENIEQMDTVRQYLTDFASQPEEQRNAMRESILAASQPYRWDTHIDMLEELFYKARDLKFNEYRGNS